MPAHFEVICSIAFVRAAVSSTPLPTNRSWAFAGVSVLTVSSRRTFHASASKSPLPVVLAILVQRQSGQFCAPTNPFPLRLGQSGPLGSGTTCTPALYWRTCREGADMPTLEEHDPTPRHYKPEHSPTHRTRSIRTCTLREARPDRISCGSQAVDC